MSASTSTRTPSRPKTVPERALASTRSYITLVCLSASAKALPVDSGRRTLAGNRTGHGLETDGGARTGLGHNPALPPSGEDLHRTAAAGEWPPADLWSGPGGARGGRQCLVARRGQPTDHHASGGGDPHRPPRPAERL